MGRSRDIERLETRVDNDFKFSEIHHKESEIYKNLEQKEDERSILKKYALLSILVTPDFLNKVKVCKTNFFKQTIFDPILGDKDWKYIFDKLVTYRNEYLKQIHVLHGKEINRLQSYTNPKTKQLRLQYEPQVHLEKKAFMPILENERKGLHKMQLVSDKKKRNHDLKMANSLIYKQIEENIIKRIEQGKNMTKELAALASLESKNIRKFKCLT
jgi:hypothetical protein